MVRVAGADVAGDVDYRLARNMVVSEFHKGRLSRLDICDAHPELLRAATNVGEETAGGLPHLRGGEGPAGLLRLREPPAAVGHLRDVQAGAGEGLEGGTRT